MKFKFITLFVLISFSMNAQTLKLLKINSDIKLPKDSIISNKLTQSLDKFLIATKTDDSKNTWIYNNQFLETSLLLDDIKDIEISKKRNDNHFYKPYLNNAIPLKDNNYFIQISYIGIDKNTAFLKANFEFIAYFINDTYKFAAPFSENTKNWHSKKINNFTFYYKDTMNVLEAEKFYNLTANYDKKIKIKPNASYYFCKDDLAIQILIGLPYKLDYNGDGSSSVWSKINGDNEIYILNESKIHNLDPHDWWHARRGKVKAGNEVNYLVDEAIATLYGGTWLLDWQGVFKLFVQQTKPTKKTDWLKLRKEKKMFGKDKRHTRPTDFMINILLVKKIEAEKGFEGVWKLLNAKEDSTYFQVLEELTGITRQNYNKEIFKIIKKEAKKYK